jgi:hypothetical protein
MRHTFAHGEKAGAFDEGQASLLHHLPIKVFGSTSSFHQGVTETTHRYVQGQLYYFYSSGLWSVFILNHLFILLPQLQLVLPDSHCR